MPRPSWESGRSPCLVYLQSRTPQELSWLRQVPRCHLCGSAFPGGILSLQEGAGSAAQLRNRLCGLGESGPSLGSGSLERTLETSKSFTWGTEARRGEGVG